MSVAGTQPDTVALIGSHGAEEHHTRAGAEGDARHATGRRALGANSGCGEVQQLRVRGPKDKLV